MPLFEGLIKARKQEKCRQRKVERRLTEFVEKLPPRKREYRWKPLGYPLDYSERKKND